MPILVDLNVYGESYTPKRDNVCKLFVLGYDLCIIKYHVQCNVTVNASGGQINDKSNALEEKREKKKFEKLKFRYRPPTAHPRMRLGVPHGLSWAKSCLTDPTALLTHCLKARH